jgi:ABC-type branched-subunit amino acid transport system substrate-binding protein
MGQAIRAVTSAYFDEINRQGGIHGRKLELKVGETGDTSAATATNLERLITSNETFALANVVTAGADSEVAAVVQKNEVPLVGAITLLPQTAAPINRQVFYLLPGVAEQARALVSFAAQKFDKTAHLAIIYTQGDTLAIVSAKAVDVQCKSVGFALPPRVVLTQGPPSAMATAMAELKNRDTQAVYLFSTGVPSNFLKEAEKANFFPNVYLLGVSAGPDILNAPVGFKGKIFLAFPTVPSDISADGMSNYRALAQKYQLPQKHVAAQLSAYGGAQLFVEGLKLAGRDLSREKLITSLEGLHEYRTGLTPAVTFGPNRRVGALGAHIVSVDLDTKQFDTTTTWVGINP